jgi:hypothetical protein
VNFAAKNKDLRQVFSPLQHFQDVVSSFRRFHRKDLGEFMEKVVVSLNPDIQGLTFYFALFD